MDIIDKSFVYIHMHIPLYVYKNESNSIDIYTFNLMNIMTTVTRIYNRIQVEEGVRVFPGQPL